MTTADTPDPAAILRAVSELEEAVRAASPALTALARAFAGSGT